MPASRKRMRIERGFTIPLLGLLLGLGLALPGCGAKESRSGWTALWREPERQGERLMEAGRFARAAELFPDLLRKGVAWYRAGEFETAVNAFSGVPTAEGQFNRGNSLIFLGKYEDAVKAFDQAMALRPGWNEAEENRKIARLRGERLKQEGGEGTGGMLEADDYVFNEGGENKAGQDSQDTVEMDGGDKLSDEELRALWLRRVQTRPGDFLRSKFAYQYARRNKGDGE